MLGMWRSSNSNPRRSNISHFWRIWYSSNSLKLLCRMRIVETFPIYRTKRQLVCMCSASWLPLSSFTCMDIMAENNKSSIVWQFFEVTFLDESKAVCKVGQFRHAWELVLVFGIRYSHSIFENSKVSTNANIFHLRHIPTKCSESIHIDITKWSCWTVESCIS